MSEATEAQRHALITIANSTAGHVVLPDYMRTDILEAASTIRDLDQAVDTLISERDEAFAILREIVAWTNTMSMRPARIHDIGEISESINEWADKSRECLGEDGNERRE